MRLLVIIFFMAMPFLSNAGWGGWSFRYISGYYGLNYSPEFRYGNSFELLYERGLTNCTVRPKYYAFGVAGNFSKEYTEAGLKGQIIPGHMAWTHVGWQRPGAWFLQRYLFQPYLFCQGNIQRQFSSASDEFSKGFNCRPGVGINISQTHPMMRFAAVRANLQAGYTFSSLEKKGLPILVEFKVGIGINVRRHRIR